MNGYGVNEWEHLMGMKPDNNQKSLAGEFAVLSQLALRGYDASMTLGHTKNIDILIHNPKTKKYFKMEVKTSTQNKPTCSKDSGKIFYQPYLSKKHEEMEDTDLLYCFVLLADDIKDFRFFVVQSKIVADYLKKEYKRWIKGAPLSGKSRKETNMRSFHLGFRDEEYKIPMPLCEDHENKWDLLDNEQITDNR